MRIVALPAVVDTSVPDMTLTKTALLRLCIRRSPTATVICQSCQKVYLRDGVQPADADLTHPCGCSINLITFGHFEQQLRPPTCPIECPGSQQLIDLADKSDEFKDMYADNKDLWGDMPARTRLKHRRVGSGLLPRVRAHGGRKTDLGLVVP
jgi:hypothetical protein